MTTKELIKRLNDIKTGEMVDEIIKALEELDVLKQEKEKDVKAEWNKECS